MTLDDDSPRETAPAVQDQHGALEKTGYTPVIEWRAPEAILYGTALSDTQLNAKGSVPGTFEYRPGAGAMLTAGAHTLSVVCTPSNEFKSAPVYATVALRVSKATPMISWPAPEPINQLTPLGPAQLDAKASVPGRFEYSRAAGDLLRSGVHTLTVKFVPTDDTNYISAEASVSLTVIEATAAEMTWARLRPVVYGTALSAEQLSARSSVPGSFLYIPPAGSVLPPGQHDLWAIFTPTDSLQYTEARASVTITVEELPITNVRETGDAVNAVAIGTRSRDDTEWFRTEPQLGEDAGEEMPLFGAYNDRPYEADSEVDEEPKRENKWLTIASVVVAIPMLCLLAFLVDKAHSGRALLPHQTKRPAATIGDAQTQYSPQDGSHRVQMTVDVPATGSAPASTNGTAESRKANSQQAAMPAHAQTETTYDQPTALTKTPRGSGKEAAKSEHANSNSGRPADSERAAGGERAANAREGSSDTGHAVRDEGSNLTVVSADAAAGRLMASQTPIYPPAARASRVTGTVVLEATIAKDGTVKNLDVLSGPAPLRQAAVNSARTWRYRPFILNHEPTEVRTIINVLFSLNK